MQKKIASRRKSNHLQNAFFFFFLNKNKISSRTFLHTFGVPCVAAFVDFGVYNVLRLLCALFTP
uniref:Uncharacterized protein n=1 Tax=Anguilla anguilla TaxID=7936 RepID=A0A0E9WK70_ANGAN